MKGPLLLVPLALAAGAAACSLGLSEGEFTGGAPNGPDAADATFPADASGENDGGVDSDTDPVTHDLLLHYRFDETAGTVVADSAPNHNDGSFVAGDAGTLPSRVTGVQGGALSFANGSYVEIARHPTIKASASFTIALWVNATPTSGAQPRLFSFGGAWEVKLNGSGAQLTLGSQYAIVAYELPAGRWTHFAAVFTAGHASWFVDGLPVPNDTDKFDGTLSASDDTIPVRFGTSEELDNFYTGLLDDARIYSVALSQEEIQLLARR